jgi:hypothetical protein
VGSKVVALSAPKEAALYFDEVLPLDFGVNALQYVINRKDTDDLYGYERLEIPIRNHSLTNKILRSLSQNNLDVEIVYNAHLRKFAWIFFASALAGKENHEARKRFVETDDYEPFKALVRGSGVNAEKVFSDISAGVFQHSQYTQSIDKALEILLGEAQFTGSPFWFHNEMIVAEGAESDQEYALTLKNLKLVDPEKISWEAIIEFRRDKESMDRLRDFRVLFHEQLAGMPKSYVEDKLLQGLDNHERIAKEWSFDLIERSLSIVGSKENIAASGLAVYLATTSGAALPIIAASGLAYSILGSSLEIGKVFRERSRTLRTGYGYLSNLQKLSRS